MTNLRNSLEERMGKRATSRGRGGAGGDAAGRMKNKGVDVAGKSKKLRVAFLHPDLGLGGAERLVVDAAVALLEAGHHVDMYTSHYEPERAFAETRNENFHVHVRGDFLPRTC